MRALWCVAFVFFGACTCGPRVMGVDPESVRVMPVAVTFDDTFVGASSLAVVTVINPSRATRQLSVSVEPPFTLVSPLDAFPSGETELQLVFTPTVVGLATGTLHVGELEVPLNGTGLQPLSCSSENPCEDSRFDAVRGACVVTARPDDEACQTRCVTGTCTTGACVGTSIDCPQTACTVGVCSEADGCGQVARECPAPSNPCQRARCDETLGCATEEAEDGTVCGVDDCRLATVEVCIIGQCVVRPRAASGQCAHTWLPLSIGERYQTALGHDAVGHRVIAFGGGGAYGKSDDTWAWDGTKWSLLTPPNAPSARNDTPLVSEGFRRAALLFGGLSFNGTLRDTWEWDGRTWLQRTPATSPPARWGHALTWDSARQRAVLFGGVGTAGRLADTWEWDGREWSQRSPAQSPSPRLRPGFAYDPVRRVTVLFGGGGTGPGGEFELTDTWEFDGTTWTQRASPMLAMTGQSRSMAWDPVTRSVMLVSTKANAVEAWRYDGSWHAVTTPPSRGFGGVLTLDADRRRLVFVSGPSTWEWDGVSFTLRSATSAPTAALPLFTDRGPDAPLLIDAQSVPWHWLDGGWSEGAPFISSPAPRSEPIGGWDPVRETYVLYGGYGSGPQLWEFAADAWSTPTETGNGPPVGCDRAAGAYDFSRSAFVVAGCQVTNDDGGRSSFEWNGATWTEHPGPPQSLRAMAWDPTHQHLVAVSNGVTFTRAGGQWTQQPNAGLTLSSINYGLVVDAARGAVVLVGEPTFGNTLTWEWTGSTWSQPVLAKQPPAAQWLHGTTLVYEPAERRVLFYDGAALWQYVP